MNHSILAVWQWKHTFTRDVFSQVIELTLSADLPSYDTILELDKKVREQVLPPSLNLYRSSVQDDYTTPSAYVRGRILFQFRTTSESPGRNDLLAYLMSSQRCCSFIVAFLHKPCLTFPQILSAVHTLHHSSLHIVVRRQRSRPLSLTSRCSRTSSCVGGLSGAIFYLQLYVVGLVYDMIFNQAQVIVGSIVTRAPSTTMAPAAWQELNLAVEMFSRGSETSSRARHGLVRVI